MTRRWDEGTGPAGQGLPTLRTKGKRPMPRLWLVCAEVWNELWAEALRSAERQHHKRKHECPAIR